MDDEIAIHCWKDKAEDAEERYGVGSSEWAEAHVEGGTCMLPAGHEGPHVFTPDGEIGVTFQG